MTHVQRPSMHDSNVVAKALITVYLFLKDEQGDEEVTTSMRS